MFIFCTKLYFNYASITSALPAHVHGIYKAYLGEALDIVGDGKFVGEQQQWPFEAVEEQHHAGIYSPLDPV